MANMELQTRNQFERVNLNDRATGVQLRSKRGLTIYAIVSTVILVVLGYAAIQEISGWAGAVVFGVILLNLVGLMIAVRPNRSSPAG
jgi:hypothetical protein